MCCNKGQVITGVNLENSSFGRSLFFVIKLHLCEVITRVILGYYLAVISHGSTLLDYWRCRNGSEWFIWGYHGGHVE